VSIIAEFRAAVTTCLSKYIDIKGRAARSEYWWFLLFNILVQIIASGFDDALGMGSAQNYGLVVPLVSLALFVPAITAGIRRLHDRDMSGWWLLMGFVPPIGQIALLVIFMMKGTEGDNRFGPDPLA
jgi:uncharacterized membrane protein YhaH (DUF805 family)